MNLPWNKTQPPYSMKEIADQIGHLAHLAKLRDAAIQKAVLYGAAGKSDKKQQTYLQEGDRYDDMIKSTQMVYEFMLDEMDSYNKRMKQKRKGK